MDRIISDPAVRKAIYQFVTVLGPILVTYGVLTDEQVSQVIALGGAAVAALTTLLAAVNTDKYQGKHVEDGVDTGAPEEL